MKELSPEHGSISDSIKLGKERLRLWLLLEAGTSEKAEPQFQRLVTMSIDVDSANGDQLANCSFLGGVLGMLQAEGPASCIPFATAENGKKLLLDKIDFKAAIGKLEEQQIAARKWGDELIAKVNEFKRVGHEKAEELHNSKQAEVEQAKLEQLDLRGKLKAAGSEKRVLEARRKKWIQARKSVIEEINKKTPGEPPYPVEPGPAPREPTRPRGRYKVDPKTLAAAYVPPPHEEESRYENHQRRFEGLMKQWLKSKADYEKARQEYPERLERWRQADASRRAILQTQKLTVEQGYAATEKAMKDMQAEINQGVANDLKQTSSNMNS